MRKLIAPIMAAALFCGCSDDLSKSDGLLSAQQGGLTVVATVEEPSRVAFKEGESACEVIWSKSDEIAIVGLGAEAAAFQLVSGEGSPRASFTGNLTGSAPYCAVFPYSGEISYSRASLSFPVSGSYAGIPDNVGTKDIPMVSAVTLSDSGASIRMRNLFGLLKVSVTSERNLTVKKVVLRDLGGNMLWGRCTVPVKDGEPDFGNVALAGGDNSISITYSVGLTLTPDKARDIYFPVPAGSLDRGFAILLFERDLYEDDAVGSLYSVIQKVTSPNAMRRSELHAYAPVTASAKTEKRDVAARGYYKQLFVDAGCYLSNYYTPSHIPAIADLGLSDDYEYIATAATATLDGNSTILKNCKQAQNAFFDAAPQGTIAPWNDSNGALLYPDGEPRFRLMYVNGGKSSKHGPTIGTRGRNRVREWFLAGGSYVGSCAGSFLATTFRGGTNRFDNPDESKNYSFGLWPGDISGTSVPVNITDYPTVGTGAKVLPDYAALTYTADYARKYGKSSIKAWKQMSAGDTIEDLPHHGGSYFPHSAANMAIPHEELIAYQWSGDASITNRANRYLEDSVGVAKQFKTSARLQDSVCIWAYKASPRSGRVIFCGSHPEKRSVYSGGNFNVMATMLLHALAGSGESEVKGELNLGAVRRMDCTTADGKPAYTRIGDRQYHHFLLETDADLKDFQLSLSGDFDENSGIDLFLTLRRGDFAWMSDADYLVCTKGCNKSLTVKNLPKGIWYVGVYCNTTVTATATSASGDGPHYYRYSGHTEVLDGVAYSLFCDASASGVIAPSPFDGHDLGSDVMDN